MDHEINYMPHNFNVRYGPLEVYGRWLKFCRDTTNEVRRSIAHVCDVPYGFTKRTKYDIYGTDLPNDAPIFVFIHGGYWIFEEVTKDIQASVVPNFVANGIKVIVADHELCPNVTLTDIVQQIKVLIEIVLVLAETFGSKCVWIGGHCSGAHLATCILHDRDWLESMEKRGCRDRLKGLILIAGIYDIEPLLRVSINEKLALTAQEINLFTFAQLNESVKTEENFEPIHNLKIIVAVGECDSPIFIEESRRYTRKVSKFVDNVEFLLLRENIDHFDIIEKLTKDDFILSKILVSNINNHTN